MAKRIAPEFYCYDSKLKGWTLINSREIFDDNGKALTDRGERYEQLKAEGIPLLLHWTKKNKPNTWFVNYNDENLPKGHAVRSGLAKKPLAIFTVASEPKAEPKPKAKQTRKAKVEAKVEADPTLEEALKQLAELTAMFQKLAA